MTRTHTPSTSLLLFLSLGAGLLLAGCSGSARTAERPGLPDRFPDHTVDQIHRQIVAATDTLHSFSAKARVTIRSPEQNRSFNAVVRQQRSDSLFMRFSLFGVEGGRLLLTADSVFFFDTRKAVLRVGSASAVEEVVPIPVSSGHLFENMLGLLAPEPGTDWTLEADSSYYYLSTRPKRRKRYMVDPSQWRVVRHVKQTDLGRTIQKRLFSDFRSVDGLLIPHQIIFRRPMDNVSATVTYRTVNLNPSNLSLTLDVPPQVPRKPLRVR